MHGGDEGGVVNAMPDVMATNSGAKPMGSMMTNSVTKAVMAKDSSIAWAYLFVCAVKTLCVEAAMTELMQGMVLTGHGGPEMLEWRDDLAVPAPGAGEVLIEVAACCSAWALARSGC